MTFWAEFVSKVDALSDELEAYSESQIGDSDEQERANEIDMALTTVRNLLMAHFAITLLYNGSNRAAR